MPIPTRNLDRWIAMIPDHSVELPHEAEVPILHLDRGINDAWGMVQYFQRNTDNENVRPSVRDRHLGRLRSLALLALVESFERFAKEVAAVCVDQLATLVLDDRFSELKVASRDFAAHFDSRTLGRALCEASTWTDSETINTRFRKLLTIPSKPSEGFSFLPNQRTDADYWRRETIDLLWQLRHTIAHNVGVMTRSDAVWLRLLRKRVVASPRVLLPTNGDVWYVKLFVAQLAGWCNQRVANRLAELLTDLHSHDHSLFDPADRARELAQVFQLPVTVAGASAAP